MSEVIEQLEKEIELEQKKRESAATIGISDYYYHEGKESGLSKAIEIIKRVSE